MARTQARSSAVRLQSVPLGTYTVYLYTWEDNAAETFSISLEGSLVQANDNSGAAGTWRRLGPWTVNVTDGTLDLTTSGGAANLSGIEVHRASSPPSGFVRGINFNGGPVSIEGNAWLSYSAALSSGLTVNAPNLATTTLTPSPATDASTSSMLNTAIWKPAADLQMGQPVSNGSYQVYLWVMENYQSNVRSFRVRLEGVEVASGVGNLALGAWRKYGPYTTTVRDGFLNLDLVATTGDSHLMGMAIFR
jgi:hypothetical protein